MPRLPRLLLVTPHPVWPPRHGFSVRLWNLLPRIAERYDVHALIFTGGTEDAAQRQAIAPFCREVVFQQLRDPARADRTVPAPARELVWKAMRDRFTSLVSAHRIDLLLLEGTELGGLVPDRLAVPAIITAHDLGFETHFLRLRVRLGRYGDERRALGPVGWLRFARYELRNLARVDQIHCMSEANARLLGRVAPRLRSRIRVVPNGVDCAAMAPPASLDRRDILILGSFPHPPNADAVRYFLAEIWPEVRRRHPSARVTLAGANPPAWVLALDGADGIRVAGEVEDVRSLLWSHAVLAVPLRAGSGTRIKILEAMGAGLPVVSTGIGAAGIDALPGLEIDIAERPDSFADRLVSRLADPAGGREMAARARSLVERRFDWRLVAERALGALGELLPAGVAPRSDAADAAPFVEPRSEIELLVTCLAGSGVAPGLLDSLSGQNYHLPFRVRFVSPTGLPDEVERELASHGFAASSLGTSSLLPGGLLDRAIFRSSADLVAILDSRDVPLSPHWLGHLLWALQQPVPAAAVIGEIVAPGEPPTAREAVATGHGFEFRLSNLAIRRDVWVAHPFGELASSEKRWPTALDEALQLLFRSPDAPVERRAGETPFLSRVESATPPRASVVVCTRDRGAAIAPTLEGLSRQEASFGWEVVVVDNGSTRESLALTREASSRCGERFRMVVEPALGLSAARNCGVRRSRGEVVLYLDDDAVPASGWLEAMVRAFDDPEVDAAGGPVEPAWEGEIPAWLRPAWLPYLTVWDPGKEPHDLRYNETPRGANMAFRRSAFERVGGFSRHLGRRGRSLRSCEEIELCLRLERLGRRIRYVPEARVRHRTPTGRLTPEWLAARFAEQGLSEAIVDWMHGGLGGLRAGLERRRASRRALAAAPTAGEELDRRFDRAAYRGYLRGMAIAVVAVPRWRPPAP